MTEQSSNPYEGFDVHEVAEQLRSPDGKGGYNRGQAFDLLANAGWDDPEHEIDDLEEAVWFLKKEIGRLRFNKLLKPPFESIEPKIAPVRIHLDILQCPVCYNVLRKSAVNFRRYGCWGTGHGWAEFEEGEFFADWQPSISFQPPPEKTTRPLFCMFCACEIKEIVRGVDALDTSETFICVNNHVMPNAQVGLPDVNQPIDKAPEQSNILCKKGCNQEMLQRIDGSAVCLQCGYTKSSPYYTTQEH